MDGQLLEMLACKALENFSRTCKEHLQMYKHKGLSMSGKNNAHLSCLQQRKTSFHLRSVFTTEVKLMPLENVGLLIFRFWLCCVVSIGIPSPHAGNDS